VSVKNSSTSFALLGLSADVVGTTVCDVTGGGGRTRLVDQGPIAWHRLCEGARIGRTNYLAACRGDTYVRGGGMPILFQGRWQ